MVSLGWILLLGVNSRRVAAKNVKLNLDLSSFGLCSVTCLKFERGNLYLEGNVRIVVSFVLTGYMEDQWINSF